MKKWSKAGRTGKKTQHQQRRYVAAQQPFADQPNQRKHPKGKTLHRQVQPRVPQAVADLFAGQVDAMEEKHHEDADVHDPFRMHCATRGAEAGKKYANSVASNMPHRNQSVTMRLRCLKICIGHRKL